MSVQRDLAVVGVTANYNPNDFMGAYLKPPNKLPTGALPAMTREMVPAQHLNALLDVVIMWGIGDFGTTYTCSTYYDPSSPWYNVFYGVYALRSYKSGALAWGYGANGQPDWVELLQVPAVDYNFLTGVQFGCPPNRMCFSSHITQTSKESGWDVCDLTAQVPSGLHDPTKYRADCGNYIVFGIPEPSFLTGRDSYESVQMVGQFYMRRISLPPPITEPVTLMWGAACPTKNGGPALLQKIMQTLSLSYLSLGG